MRNRGEGDQGRPFGDGQRRQAAFVACYFAVYTGYLFVHPEGEALHWLTLVLLPLAGLAAIGPHSTLPHLLRSIGVERAHATHGLGWSVALGAGFQVVQLLNTRQRSELLTVLDRPYGPLLPIAAFVLLLATVATTEEVFFRGIMQNRLSAQFRSGWLGLLVTTVAFTLYHVPYAYLKPSWPSAGDLPAAIRLAAANGVVGGLALGFVFRRSGGNLLSAIALHAFVDLMPATRLLARLIERQA